MSDYTVKVAVLGMGRIGKRHCDIVRRLKNFKLASTIDPQEENELNIPHFRSFNEFLDSDIDTDLIAICTPNGLHSSQAVQCLKNNYHVLVEKPMALTSHSAEIVIETALQKNRRVFCVMQNRYSPISQWLKECLDEKLLGDIYMVDVQCYWNRDERYYLENGNRHAWHGDAELDGGPLFTQFSHFVDMVYWLFGEWQNIRSSRRSFRNKEYTAFEDSGIIQFDLDGGAMGTFSYSTATYDRNLMSALTIIAENGTIRVGGQYMQELITEDIATYEMPMEWQREIERPSTDNHIHIYENIYDVLYDNKSISTNAYEGMKVVEIIEQVYEASPAIVPSGKYSEE